MAEFREYINEDASDADKAALQKIQQGLRGLEIEARVAEVAEQRQILQKRKTRIQKWFGFVGVLLLGAALFFYVTQQAKTIEPPVIQNPTQREVVPPTPNQPIKTQEGPKNEPLPQKKSEPIAEGPKQIPGAQGEPMI
jgi:hypothetical protein